MERGESSRILFPQGIHTLGYILSSEYNITRDILGQKKIVKRIPRKETIAFGQLDLKVLGQTHFGHRKQSCRLIDLPGAQI